MRPLLDMYREELGGKLVHTSDILAGLTVAVVALPLALAFGISSEMGAAAGLVSAIVAGIVAAALGGSRFQVSGPTGAMTVILLPIVHRVGIPGVLAAGMLAGGLLVAAGFLKLGSHIHKLPVSLIEGFTAGIAVVIALQQVPLIWPSATHSDHIALTALLDFWRSTEKLSTSSMMALGVAATLYIARHRWTLWPKSLIVIISVTAYCTWADVDIATVGELPAQLFTFSFDFLRQPSGLLVIVPPAVSIAILAALESLLSAKVADNLRGDSEHDADRELVGQGVANLVTPLFGGVPATAALARTAVNVHAGAQTRFAAIFHALALALAVVLLAEVVSEIPIAALAGVLWATTAQMIKIKELKAEAAQSKLDALILVTTFVTTILVDLISAVALGTALWLLLRRRLTSRRDAVVNEEETLGD